MGKQEERPGKFWELILAPVFGPIATKLQADMGSYQDALDECDAALAELGEKNRKTERHLDQLESRLK